MASEITKSSCKVSWDPPDFDGGSPIVHYVLQVSFMLQSSQTLLVKLPCVTSRGLLCIDAHMQRREAGRRTYVNMMSGENKVSWNVKDLIPNGEYYFRVQAVNKIGGGEFIELRNPVIAEDQKRKIFGIIAILLALVNEHYGDIFPDRTYHLKLIVLHEKK